MQGTGTEDYIGSGWGQGVYHAQRFGSLISDKENDIYVFYRFHTADAVYFHRDIKVTIQQMGNSNRAGLRKMKEAGMEFLPVWHLETYGQSVLDARGKPVEHVRFLDMANPPDVMSDAFPEGGSTNYYRQDDVSATAYFYLDSPQSNLPPIAPVEIRLEHMQNKVWDKILK